MIADAIGVYAQDHLRVARTTEPRISRDGEQHNCDLRREEREYSNGQGHYQAVYNAGVPGSLLSGSFEFQTSAGTTVTYEGCFSSNEKVKRDYCLTQAWGTPSRTKVDESLVAKQSVAYQGNRFARPHGPGVRREGPCTYSGQWQDGKEHGTGEWRDEARNESYLGEWRHGRREGFGVAHYASGEAYEGDWKEGQFHNRGTYYYCTGDKFNGVWDKGQKSEGVLYFRDGRISRRVFVDGRLQSVQEYDPVRKLFLPTVTREDVHVAPLKRYVGITAKRPASSASARAPQAGTRNFGRPQARANTFKSLDQAAAGMSDSDDDRPDPASIVRPETSMF